MGAEIKKINHSGRPAKLNQKVKCLETGEVFSSYREAATALGLNRSNLYNCLKGFRNSVGGYHFEYCEESDDMANWLDEIDHERETCMAVIKKYWSKNGQK